MRDRLVVVVVIELRCGCQKMRVKVGILGLLRLGLGAKSAMTWVGDDRRTVVDMLAA